MKGCNWIIVVTTMMCCSLSAYAELELRSQDIAHGQFMDKKHEYNGFGCTGGNASPQFSWSNVPAGTKSFALTAYDPDAPTGSGWWHWLVINIAKEVKELPDGLGLNKNSELPKGAQQMRTDYGEHVFGGACPPKGDKAHRYQFKLFALNVDKLDLPVESSAALVGYYLNAHAIETATIEALYKR